MNKGCLQKENHCNTVLSCCSYKKNPFALNLSLQDLLSLAHYYSLIAPFPCLRAYHLHCYKNSFVVHTPNVYSYTAVITEGGELGLFL